MKWEKKTLDELGTVGRGRSKHRPRNDPKLFGGKYPFIQTADVKNANFYIINFSSTYNEEGLAQSKLWPAGTLCITIAANIADTGILAIPACFPDSIMGFVANEEIADTRFVKYCFDVLQKECKQISQGTAQDNLSWEKLSTIKFLVPPLQTQKRIASILSAYDDLIENNQKHIKLVEEAAQRLYKEWFVDLRFPGHEGVKIVDGVPEGWKIKKIEELADTMSGGTPTRSHEEYYSSGKILWLKTKELNDGFIFDTEEKITEAGLKNSSAKLFEKGCIILAMYGATIGRLGISSVTMCCNQACCVLKIKEIFLFEYVYLWLVNNREMLISRGRGSAQSNLSQELIKQIEVRIPSDGVLIKFSNVVDKLLKNKEILEKQISSLREARDRLLPKLMSGEIEV